MGGRQVRENAQPMWSVVVGILPIILGASILMLGNSLLGISVALKLNAAGVSQIIIGLSMTGYFAGFMVGAVYGKRLIARVGHIRAYAGLAAIVSAAILAHALEFNPWFWIGLRVIAGVCMAGLFTAMESWLNDRSTNETRGQIVTIHMSSYFLALCLGQLLVNVWDLSGNKSFIFAAMLATFSLVPVTLGRMPSPSVESVAPMSPLDVFRFSPLAATGAAMGGLMTSPMYGLSAVFAQDIGFSVFQVSLFTGAMLFGPLDDCRTGWAAAPRSPSRSAAGSRSAPPFSSPAGAARCPSGLSPYSPWYRAGWSFPSIPRASPSPMTGYRGKVTCRRRAPCCCSPPSVR
jgi:MFS family permease